MPRRRDTRPSKEFYRVKGSGLSMRPVPGSTKQSEQIFRKRGTEILVLDLVCELTLASVFPRRDVMREPVDIDFRHSLAIVKKIGERLRASFKEDEELPVNLREQIERLRQSESEAQANLARSSRGDKS